VTPIPFPQQNLVVGANQPEYIPLPVYYSADNREATACWGLTWSERLRALFTGRIYVTLMTFGMPMMPQRVSLDPPHLAPEGEPW
jgi:hypothetical protein